MVTDAEIDGLLNSIEKKLGILENSMKNLNTKLPFTEVKNIVHGSITLYDEIKRDIVVAEQKLQPTIDYMKKRKTSKIKKALLATGLAASVTIGSPSSKAPPPTADTIATEFAEKKEDERIKDAAETFAATYNGNPDFSNEENMENFINGLETQIEAAKKNMKNAPDYIQKLIADGKIDIGYCASHDLAGGIWASESYYKKVGEQRIKINIQFADTEDEFKKVMEDCEVVFWNAHASYGLGPRIGLAIFPFHKKGHVITVPKSYLNYLKNPVYKDGKLVRPGISLQGKYEVVGYTNYKDIYYGNIKPGVKLKCISDEYDKLNPHKGFQLIIAASCSSGTSFKNDLEHLRKGLPTTVILTKRETFTDANSSTFHSFLNGICNNRKITEVIMDANRVEKINLEIIAKKGEEHVMPSWKNIDTFYVGIMNSDDMSTENLNVSNMPNSALIFRP